MASIRKRSGKWQAQIRVLGFDPVSQTFTSRIDAVKWGRQLESEMERGLFVPRHMSEQVTINELVDRYERDITPQKRSASTDRCNRRIKRVFGNRVLATIRPSDVARFRDERLAAGKSGATVIKDLNLFSHLIDTAMREWECYLPQNPVRMVKRPAVNRGRNRRLGPGEEDKLLESCRAGRTAGLDIAVILALETYRNECPEHGFSPLLVTNSRCGQS